MKLTLLNLFGKSPFVPLKSHMDLVKECVDKVPLLFEALENRDYQKLETTAQEISSFEHKADLMKNDLRNHLPRSIYLPVDRGCLLEILSIQDGLADKAEDVAVLINLKPITLLPSFKEDFFLFLAKNLEAFYGAKAIIDELHELIESSFGGNEAEKVEAMVADIAFKEHEADLIQRRLLKAIYQAENEMPYTTFFLWQKIFTSIAALSNLSEKLGNRIRMMLDLK